LSAVTILTGGPCRYFNVKGGKNMSTAILFWVLVLILLVYGVFIYNSLVQIKHNVAKAWSNIDVLLKQRHDELPKLVETCKQYKQFEQDTLRQVTEARTRVQQASAGPGHPRPGPGGRRPAPGPGPDLRGGRGLPGTARQRTLRPVDARITGLEDAIADRRELYNESVNINNARIEQFPDLFVAHLFRFGRQAPAYLQRGGQEGRGCEGFVRLTVMATSHTEA
jgi:LemA protein